MRRPHPLSGVSSQWAHDDSAFVFPRTSGLTRYDFASDRPPFPWRPLLVVVLLIAIAAWITSGTADDETISARLHQINRSK
jgi:hypothetical protein